MWPIMNKRMLWSSQLMSIPSRIRRPASYCRPRTLCSRHKCDSHWLILFSKLSSNFVQLELWSNEHAQWLACPPFLHSQQTLKNGSDSATTRRGVIVNTVSWPKATVSGPWYIHFYHQPPLTTWELTPETEPGVEPRRSACWYLAPLISRSLVHKVPAWI